jgi:hypothetical protein
MKRIPTLPKTSSHSPAAVEAISRAKDKGLNPQDRGPFKRLDIIKKARTVYQAPTIIGTCITCIAPTSLSATLALIVIGASIAPTVERRKLARVRGR